MGRTTPFSRFKRDLDERDIYLSLIERYGKTGDQIPERPRGIRKVKRVSSSSITLLCMDGTESHLTYGTTKLFGYDGEYFSVHQPGKRVLSSTEKQVLDGSKVFYETEPWLVEDYFKGSSCPWMVGDRFIKGKCYSNGVILDNNIIGDRILLYRVV